MPVAPDHCPACRGNPENVGHVLGKPAEVGARGDGLPLCTRVVICCSLRCAAALALQQRCRWMRRITSSHQGRSLCGRRPAQTSHGFPNPVSDVKEMLPGTLDKGGCERARDPRGGACTGQC